MEIINSLIDNYNIPLLSAFLLGILTSISPCPLATNITAVAFISKDFKNPERSLWNGLYYTLGRALSYIIIAALIYFGFSTFKIAGIFQGWGDKVLGLVMIIIGLLMFGFIKINLNFKSEKIEKAKVWLARQGYLGSFLLGMLFALAFCPYSGALFFGAVIPLIIHSHSGLLLSPIFGLGTGLPVVIFAFLLAYSTQKIGKTFSVIQKIEKVMRYLVATIFILVGIYYSQFLLSYLVSFFQQIGK
ncbi:MAG: aromatic aminobenezylarsenical efflux permease ArsG family transporter [Patescibacteria group bacterium]